MDYKYKSSTGTALYIQVTTGKRGSWMESKREILIQKERDTERERERERERESERERERERGVGYID